MQLMTVLNNRLTEEGGVAAGVKDQNLGSLNADLGITCMMTSSITQKWRRRSKSCSTISLTASPKIVQTSSGKYLQRFWMLLRQRSVHISIWSITLQQLLNYHKPRSLCNKFGLLLKTWTSLPHLGRDQGQDDSGTLHSDTKFNTSISGYGCS